MPPGKTGWLIMFDEANTAPRQNLAASYKIFLDRAVGSHKLHPNCRLMMGGNLIGEGLAGMLPSPLVSRLAHIEVTPELVPAHENILGPRIFGFLRNNPKYLYVQPTEPNTPFPTLRTWEFVHNYEKANQNPTIEGYTGIVGLDAAVNYVAYLQTHRTNEAILNSTEPFELDQSQDILEFLKKDVIALASNLHRFQGEWHVLAKVELDTIRENMASTNQANSN